MNFLVLMMKYKIKIGKDFLELMGHSKNYILAQFLTMGLAFFTLPIFTRLMNPAEYGIMSVFISLEGIVTIIFGIGIRGAVSRYYYEGKNDFYGFLSSNVWFVLVSGIGLTVLAFSFRNQIQPFLNIPQGLILIAFFVALPQALFQLYQSYLQASKRSKKVASLNVVSALIGTGLAIAIMYQLKEERYYAKALGQGAAALSMLLVTFFSLHGKLVFSIKKEHIGYSLIFGLPVVFHLLSQNLLNTFDQVIINQLVGQYETGIYSVAYKVGMVQSIVSMGILNAWTPMFYAKMNKREYVDITELAKKYAFIVMLVAVFLIFYAKEILSTLVDKEYLEAVRIIPIIIASYFFFFLYTMYVNYAFYEKKTKNIALITIFAGSINILLNYLLIPKFGYIAAAWTTLLSYIFLFLLHYVNVKWVIKVNRIVGIQTFLLPTAMLLFLGFLYFLFSEIKMCYFLSLFIRSCVFLMTICFAYFVVKSKRSQV